MLRPFFCRHTVSNEPNMHSLNDGWICSTDGIRNDRRKPRYLQRVCPCVTLARTSPTWTALASKSGVTNEKSLVHAPSVTVGVMTNSWKHVHALLAQAVLCTYKHALLLTAASCQTAVFVCFLFASITCVHSKLFLSSELVCVCVCVCVCVHACSWKY